MNSCVQLFSVFWEQSPKKEPRVWRRSVFFLEERVERPQLKKCEEGMHVSEEILTSGQPAQRKKVHSWICITRTKYFTIELWDRRIYSSSQLEVSVHGWFGFSLWDYDRKHTVDEVCSLPNGWEAEGEKSWCTKVCMKGKSLWPNFSSLHLKRVYHLPVSSQAGDQSLNMWVYGRHSRYKADHTSSLERSKIWSFCLTAVKIESQTKVQIQPLFILWELFLVSLP